MNDEELKKLEETIAASFIRAKVLSVQDARDAASLAVTHMRNALALKSVKKGAV